MEWAEGPYLYNIIVELLNNDGTVIDCVTERTGLRYFAVDPNHGFFLNSEHYPLHGFNRHEDVDGKGSALSRRTMNAICNSSVRPVPQ